MNQSDETPPLPGWPFFIADLLLLGTAALIGNQAPPPYSGSVVIGIGLLIATGAALGVLPFVLNHTRREDRSLTERQREIAALAQTIGTAAEQLSIAASGLHGIADTASKSLKQAELLPAKLQEKIHEFKEQLNEVALTENEALSQEVNTLRAAETERIETVVTTVRKLSGEIARLEAASRKNVAELAETLARFTASAEQAAVEATTSVASVRSDAEKSLASGHAAAMGAIEQTLREALLDIDQKLTSFSGQLTARIDHAAQVLDEKVSALQIQASDPSHVRSSNLEAGGGSRPLRAAGLASAVSATLESTQADSKRRANSEAVTAVVETKAARKREDLKKRGEEDEFSLGLNLSSSTDGEINQTTGDVSAAEPSVSTDGFTRLTVTAYIGIGNKLFARGEGPGLSWEKGTPLQFVSIGKWRWETADATAPVRIKIYKNDEVECTSIGEVSLETGRQHEVLANF